MPAGASSARGLACGGAGPAASPSSLSHLLSLLCNQVIPTHAGDAFCTADPTFSVARGGLGDGSGGGGSGAAAEARARLVTLSPLSPAAMFDVMDAFGLFDHAARLTAARRATARGLGGEGDSERTSGEANGEGGEGGENAGEEPRVFVSADFAEAAEAARKDAEQSRGAVRDAVMHEFERNKLAMYSRAGGAVRGIQGLANKVCSSHAPPPPSLFQN